MSPEDVIPLHLVFEDQVQAFCANLPAPAQRWVRAQGWSGERHRLLLLPDAQGELCAAAYGLGKRAGEINLWHAAGLPGSLPARRFRLAQSFTAAEATAILSGFAYGSYRFDRYRKPAPARLATLEPPANADQAHARRLEQALRLGRDFINTPAADFGPGRLLGEMRELAGRRGAAFRQWRGDELQGAGFPAVHAVGRAAAEPPGVGEIRWSPPGAKPGELPRVTLVGKGVCFDSGGLDIKPAAGLLLMKKDMGGAAAVLALADLAMDAGLRAELRVLVPAVENAIGGNAYRPGDVLATRKGLTVEVGNTDAEGRLVLCDALAAADEEPGDVLIDFATLTGAARVALGPDLPALFGTDPVSVQELCACGDDEADPLWPMPLWSGYEDELASKIADINNVSASPFAGAIFGALFLRRFVTAHPRWLHVDLYGWNPRERPGRPVGAELQGVRAFHRWLLRRFGAALP
ncbi:MAG: leucyl aminopeptidase family protein [Steroidobacteraceae bacterium]